MSYTFEGDAAEASKWYAVAETELSFMKQIGTPVMTISPVDGVVIMLQLEPENIHIITKGGGVEVFITDGRHSIWRVDDDGNLGPEEIYDVLPEYATIGGNGVTDRASLGSIDPIIQNAYPGGDPIPAPAIVPIAYETVIGSWCAIKFLKEDLTRMDGVEEGEYPVNWDFSKAVMDDLVYESPSDTRILAARSYLGLLMVVEGATLKVIDPMRGLLAAAPLPAEIRDPSLFRNYGTSPNLAKAVRSLESIMLNGSRVRFSPSSNELYVRPFPLVMMVEFPILWRLGFTYEKGSLSCFVIEKIYERSLRYRSLAEYIKIEAWALLDYPALPEYQGLLSPNEWRAIMYTMSIAGTILGRLNWKEVPRVFPKLTWQEEDAYFQKLLLENARTHPVFPNDPYVRRSVNGPFPVL